MAFDVIVVGGGVAGLSAATRLAADGARVLLVEARRALGGRACSFVDPATGETIDNGQHLLLGCCRETFALLERIGAREHVRVQPALEVPLVGPEGGRTVLRCRGLPAPFNLLAAVLRWDGVGLGDRLSALRVVPALCAARKALREAADGLPAPGAESETVESWLARHRQGPRLREMLWEPLALAVLNQPARQASAAPWLRVLARMLGPDPRDAAIAFPTRPLARMYAEPARAYIESRGGEVRIASPARVRIAGGRAAGIEVRGSRVEARTVIVAVPWHALAGTLGGGSASLAPIVEAAAGMEASPIVTVNLWFDRDVLPAPFIGLPGRIFQWVFDTRRTAGGRAARLSLVSSGAVTGEEPSSRRLAEIARAELAVAVPAAGEATLVRSLVVRERRATFSLAPGLPRRPAAGTEIEGLYLAGDWTDTGLPATIEGAAWSGHRAARLAAGARP